MSDHPSSGKGFSSKFPPIQLPNSPASNSGGGSPAAAPTPKKAAGGGATLKSANSPRTLPAGSNPGPDTRLVYSTDPALNQKCTKCKEVLSECTCPTQAEVSKYKFFAVLRIEKTGRKGKTVTVIDQLPKNEVFLKNLTTLLKKKCGSGGTYLMDGRDGVIEIQGDKRDLIRAALAQEGIRSKG